MAIDSVDPNGLIFDQFPAALEADVAPIDEGLQHVELAERYYAEAEKDRAMANAYASGEARRQFTSRAQEAGLIRTAITVLAGTESTQTHIIDMLRARQMRKAADRHELKGDIEMLSGVAILICLGLYNETE